jgi:serine/threonine protein kinase
MGFLQAIILAAIAFILVGETACDVINFPNFDTGRDAHNFIMPGSSISQEALQVTPDSGNPDAQYTITNRSGRVLLKNSFRLYRRNKTASFSTSFVLNIQVKNGNGGEGLAFLITSYDDLPANSFGEWLGLFNASTNGKSSSKVLAVEFDTRQSPGTNDPDGNHVGINVNSINSKTNVSLDQYKINLKGGYDIQAWIMYDGDTEKLDVYVAKVANISDPMPSKPVVSSIIDLSTVLDQKAYFGFSASTGVDTELNCIKSWNFTIEPVSLPNRTLIIALPVCLSLAVVSVIGIIVLFKHRKAQAREENKIFNELEKIPGRLLEFRYKDLKKATNNFSPAALLGSGGFGKVYKGILPKGGNVVAVKRMTKDAKRGKEEFIAEISVINRLRHKNLVPLLGWCHEKGELIMVYEYMPNASLDNHIFIDDIAGGFLDWEQRYNIVSGVALALLYLHEECEQQVIHRDVKASNIMLDSEYKARLGDFGLARLIEHDRRSFTATGLVGTMGYIAPECFHTGRPTAESDVFSFGAVALEVTCGRPPTFRNPEASDLIGWVWKLYRENKLLEAADIRLTKFGSIDVNEEDIERLLMLGLACSNPNPEARPTMREVTQILARTMPLPYVPPFRPAFVWSHLPSDISFATTFTTSSGNTSGSVLNSMDVFLPPSDLNGNATTR